MCSYQGKVLSEPACEATCQGCEWTSNVSSAKQGTSCLFEWTVERENCDFQTDETFTGSTTVPCDQVTKLTFYCDSQQACPGYELTLTGDACPKLG